MSERQETFFDSKPGVKTIRETKEEREKENLSPFAQQSAESRGRLKPEDQCTVRTIYERDVGRIIYSLPFRRLRHKTQVFSTRKTIMSHAHGACALCELSG